MWFFLNQFLHKIHSLLVRGRNWTTLGVTIFKADFSSSVTLSASARQRGAKHGWLDIHVNQHGFSCNRLQVLSCEYLATKFLGFGILFFSGTVDGTLF